MKFCISDEQKAIIYRDKNFIEHKFPGKHSVTIWIDVGYDDITPSKQMHTKNLYHIYQIKVHNVNQISR